VPAAAPDCAARHRPRGLEEPNALRWRATFRSCAPLIARSAIRAATALDVNRDQETSPVADYAAAEVSPAVRTASLRSLGAHVVSLVGMPVQSGSSHADLHLRGHFGAPKSAGYCLAGTRDAVRPNYGSDDVPKRCCGRVNA